MIFSIGTIAFARDSQIEVSSIHRALAPEAFGSVLEPTGQPCYWRSKGAGSESGPGLRFNAHFNRVPFQILKLKVLLGRAKWNSL
jgi:hypothetical protein